MRKFLILLFALSALIGSLVTVFATMQQRDTHLRGYVDATQNADLPFLTNQRLGVNAELTQYSSEELTKQLNLMRAAHITWVRQFVRWDEIQPQSGEYDWSQWDQITAAFAGDPDLQLIAVIVNSPSWAREVDSPIAPPSDPQPYADFAQAFAKRYGQIINYYQIWDEPNLIEALGGQQPRPTQYAAMLEAAYTAIHSADPQATVISGALAPTTEQGPNNINEMKYLRDLYALDADRYFDAVGAKPYGFNDSPEERLVRDENLNFSRVVFLREIMVENGDGQKPIWASGWGWNSLPENWTGAPSIWGSVTERQQIDFTLSALNRVEREWPWMTAMILHQWQPYQPEDNPEWGFSLLAPDGTPKPLYTALAERPQATLAYNGLYAAANPYAEYSGVWTFGELGADIGWINDSQVSFNFAGSAAALLVRKDDYVGYFYPTVDGQPANALPADNAGNSYIILTSDTLQPQIDLVSVAHNLPNAPHTLHVIADDLVPDEAQDRWSLVGYAVSSGDLAQPYNQLIATAWITALAAACATVVTALQVNWTEFLSPLKGIWKRLGGTGQLVAGAIASIALLIGMLLTWGDTLPALFRREPVALSLALVTAGIIYIQPGLILTLIALIFLFVIIYNRLDIGLLLVLFWSPFFLFPVELYRFAFPLAEILTLLTFSAWLLRVFVQFGKSHRQSAPHTIFLTPRFHMLDIGLIAWVGLSLLSYSWAELKGPALTDIRVMTVEPALFYLILRTLPLTRRDLLRLVDALLCAGFIVSIIGLWLYFQGAVITAEGGVPRLLGVYGSPNNVGLLLGRCLPFILAFILLPVDRPRRLIAALFGAVMLVAVLLSQSAGALFVGIPVSLAAVLILIWGRKALLPLGGLFAVGAAGFALALQSARFARLLDFTSGTNFARIRVWQSALNIIRDQPLTGIGPDQFLYAFRSKYILPDAWQEPDLSHPHNFILDLWARLGLFGVFIFIAIQAAFWSTALRAYRFYRTRDNLSYALVIGAMGSMVNLLAHGLVDNSIYVQDLTYIFVFLLGLTLKLSNTGAIDEDS